MKSKKIVLTLLAIISLIIISLLGLSVYANSDIANARTSKVLFLSEVEKNDINTKKNNMQKKAIMDGENEIQLEYKQTKDNKDIYVSSTKDEYIYKNNTLIGFIKNVKDDINKTKLNSEAAQDIARTFLEEHFSDNQKYVLTTSNYISSYAEYSFIYNNKLNGIDTNDIIKINVNNDGEVVSFSNFNQGMFEQYKDIQIDMELVEKDVAELLKNKYGDNYVSSKITYSFLNFVNDKLVLQIDVAIEVTDQLNTTILDTILYELN